MENLNKKLVDFALSFVGITEEGGDNKGPQVEEFQKAVDGKAQGEPWCAAYAMFCLKKVSEDHGIYLSEHCLTIWNKTSKSRRVEKPRPGDLIIWQYYKNGRPTSSGHIGICTSESFETVPGTNMVNTVEGNTGPSSAVERNGDGVYTKKRSLVGTSSMKVVGFLRPF